MFPAAEPEPLHRSPDPEVFQTFDGRARHAEQRYLFQSPWFAAALSVFVMGLGQLFNGQTRRGLTFLFSQVAIGLYYWDHTSGRVVSEALIGLVGQGPYTGFFWLLMAGGAVVWAFNVYDAYEVARFVSFIYDRHSQVILEDLDTGEAFAQERSVGVRRGALRQAGFVAGAVAVYTVFIFALGSQIGGGGEFDDLMRRLEGSENAELHLNAAQFFMRLEQFDHAHLEYERAQRFARSTSQQRAAEEGLARVGALQVGIPVPPEPPTPGATRVAAVSPGRTPDALVPDPTLFDGGETPPATGLALDAPPPEEPGPELPGTPSVAPGAASVDVEYALERAELELNLGNVDGARDALAPLASVSPEPLRLALLRGRLASRAGRHDEAAAAFDRAVELDPGEPQAYLGLADVAAARGQAREAEAYLKRAVVAAPEAPDAVRRYAEHLAEGGRAGEAYEVVARALTAHPSDQELLYLSFEYSRADDNSERAYEAARALDRAGYRSGEVQAFLAERALAGGDVAAAARHAGALKRFEPGHPQAVLLEAKVLQRQRKGAEVVELLRPWIGSGSLELAVVLAQAAKSTRQYPLGIQALETALEVHPPEASALKLLGILHKRTGSLPSALAAYERALELEPGDKEALYLAGYVHYRLGQYSDGIEVYERVRRKDPGYGETEFYLAACLEGAGRSRDAIEAYGRVPEDSSNHAKAQEAVDRLTRRPAPTPARTPDPATPPTRPASAASAVVPAPTLPSPSRDPSDFAAQPFPPPAPPPTTSTSVDAYASILKEAEVSFQEGRLEEALGKYEGVLAVKPDHFRSHYQRGLILRDLGRPQSAIESFQLARSLDPEHVGNLAELGQLLAERQRYGPAVTIFEEALRVEPQNLAVRYKLGVLYERMKSFAKAEEQYQAILWYHPEYGQAHEYLGNVYYKQAKYERASRAFEALLEAEPDNMVVRFKVALTYLQLDRTDRARVVLDDLLTRLPGDHPLRPQVQSYRAGL